jgi:Ni/Fe-hydrogenase subunit HybB-like protein
MSTRNDIGSTLVNHWQRGVPVYREPVMTPALVFFGVLAAVGLALAAVRFLSPLGPFSGMNDAYAWGIWKTFNVMTLTAIGSGPLAVGMAAWVFNRQKLHVVMRTALVTGFLFYATGLVALGFDVGRTWNFYNILLPWRWNLHSAMFEIAFCMPTYCCLFLAFECLPMVLERFYYTGTDATKAFLRYIAPRLRRIYPFAITGAYILPLMHQSSLGGLMLLGGDKVNPLWQTPMLPLLYLVAAGLCGLGFVAVILCITCLHHERRLDIGILSELGSLLSWVCFGFVVLQCADLAVRGQIAAALRLDRMSVLLLLQMAMILAPAIALRNKVARETPHTLVNMSVLACLGGMLYRFIPTTIAFHPANRATYFPSVPEFLMTIGYISLGILAVQLAVKYFAVLPGDLEEWNHMFRPFRRSEPQTVRTPWQTE